MASILIQNKVPLLANILNTAKRGKGDNNNNKFAIGNLGH